MNYEFMKRGRHHMTPPILLLLRSKVGRARLHLPTRADFLTARLALEASLGPQDTRASAAPHYSCQLSGPRLHSVSNTRQGATKGLLQRDLIHRIGKQYGQLAAARIIYLWQIVRVANIMQKI